MDCSNPVTGDHPKISHINLLGNWIDQSRFTHHSGLKKPENQAKTPKSIAAGGFCSVPVLLAISGSPRVFMTWVPGRSVLWLIHGCEPEAIECCLPYLCLFVCRMRYMCTMCVCVHHCASLCIYISFIWIIGSSSVETCGKQRENEFFRNLGKWESAMNMGKQTVVPRCSFSFTFHFPTPVLQVLRSSRKAWNLPWLTFFWGNPTGNMAFHQPSFVIQLPPKSIRVSVQMGCSQ